MIDNFKINNSYCNLYNGQWISCENKIPIYSPIDNKFIGDIPAFSKSDVDNSILNSNESQKSWCNVPIHEKCDILYKTADIIDENIDILIETLILEIAKDKLSCISEVKRTADFIRYTADIAKDLEGKTISADSFSGFSKNKLAFVTRVPLGTILCISPFNYPINLSASKIAPALVIGNTVILKPPTQGSISALYLAKCFNDAGLPKGVLNTITGKGSEIGDYLVTHKNIDFINFTGSTNTGSHISSISTMTPTLLELGGKDAAIVLEDANIEKTAKEIVSGAFSYSGQRCTAIKRVLVLDTIANKLSSEILKNLNAIKIGSPYDDSTITPLIDSKAADFVMDLISDALNKGASLLIGNKRNDNLVYPTLLDNVSLDMRIAWEEPFGPVLPIIRVKSIDEAIEIANKSEYGLQSSIFTDNINDAFYIANKLEVGSVQINSKTERGPDHFPFSGVKASGMGTQGIKYSIEAMSRLKTVVFTYND